MRSHLRARRGGMRFLSKLVRIMRPPGMVCMAALQSRAFVARTWSFWQLGKTFDVLVAMLELR